MTGAPDLLPPPRYDPAIRLDLRWTGVDEATGFRRLSYQSTRGERVPAVLAVASGSRAAPAILLQHGGGDSKDERLMQAAMRRWSRAGFACLAIDAPLHGERQQREATSTTQRLRARAQNVVDLRRALDLLETLPEVDAGRVGYWGVSMGAALGVPLAAADARVRVLCLALGGSRTPTASASEEDLGLFALIDPVRHAPAIAPRPVLMLNGSRDETTRPESALALYAALGEPREIRWYPTGHKLTAAGLTASLRFLARELEPAATLER